jgi:hypothetical protein
LNLKSFRPVELNRRHQRDGLRPGSIADANDQAGDLAGTWGRISTFDKPTAISCCPFDMLRGSGKSL